MQGFACRSPSRAMAAANTIRAAHASASVAPMQLDLSDLDSVVSFADSFAAKHDALHVLCNSAGLGGMGNGAFYGEAEVYRVNFVGHFLLTLRLLPLLERSAPSRIVNLSSLVHRFAGTDWHAALPGGHGAYQTSKLAMAVFGTELSRRYASKGVTAISVNPGAVNSQIWYRGQIPGWLEPIVAVVFRRVFLTSAQGAACSVAAATDPALAGSTGLYLCPYRVYRCVPRAWGWAHRLVCLLCDVGFPFTSFVGASPCPPLPAVTDPTEGTRLWEATATAVDAWLSPAPK